MLLVSALRKFRIVTVILAVVSGILALLSWTGTLSLGWYRISFFLFFLGLCIVFVFAIALINVIIKNTV